MNTINNFINKITDQILTKLYDMIPSNNTLTDEGVNAKIDENINNIINELLLPFINENVIMLSEKSANVLQKTISGFFLIEWAYLIASYYSMFHFLKNIPTELDDLTKIGNVNINTKNQPIKNNNIFPQQLNYATKIPLKIIQPIISYFFNDIFNNMKSKCKSNNNDIQKKICYKFMTKLNETITKELPKVSLTMSDTFYAKLFETTKIKRIKGGNKKIHRKSKKYNIISRIQNDLINFENTTSNPELYLNRRPHSTRTRHRSKSR